MKHRFNFEKEVLSYTKWGDGAEVIFMFHGFGQDATVFQELATLYTSRGYTVYSFDLFFHGESVWSFEKRNISKEYLQSLFNKFCQINSIHSYSIVAFSIGARFALTLAEPEITKVNRLMLLAPDGIVNSRIYSIVTAPFGLRGLFKFTVRYPGVYFGLLNLLRAIRCIDSTSYRLAQSQMQTRDQRRRVYNSWIYFKGLKSDYRRIFERTSTVVFVGEGDKIIKPKAISKRVQKCQQVTFLQVKSAHHVNLIKKMTEQINNNSIPLHFFV